MSLKRVPGGQHVSQSDVFSRLEAPASAFLLELYVHSYYNEFDRRSDSLAGWGRCKQADAGTMQSPWTTRRALQRLRDEKNARRGGNDIPARIKAKQQGLHCMWRGTSVGNQVLTAASVAHDDSTSAGAALATFC